jgi:N12 class adenine-specific DNA methylase
LLQQLLEIYYSTSIDLEERGSTAHQYKPGPQARYLVDKMADLEKTLLEAVNKLSEKMDVYDKRLTTLGSDIAKVQSQVDYPCSPSRCCRKNRFSW